MDTDLCEPRCDSRIRACTRAGFTVLLVLLRRAMLVCCMALKVDYRSHVKSMLLFCQTVTSMWLRSVADFIAMNMHDDILMTRIEFDIAQVVDSGSKDPTSGASAVDWIVADASLICSLTFKQNH